MTTETTTSIGLVTRSFELDDIVIRTGGDGRTVDAYCAVFEQPAVVDNRLEGRFNEIIARGSFDKTIRENASRFFCLFNHGKTMYGTPSERFAMPLGKPLEVKADNKGVFTSTQYNRTQLADEVLEGIRNGEITGQSFTGRFLGSNPPQRGRVLPNRDGTLKTIRRTEIAMQEYGPGIVPVYNGASIVGVRSEDLTSDAIAELLDNLDLEPAARAQLLDQLHQLTGVRPGGPPIERHDAGPAATSDALARSWASVRTSTRLKGIRS